MKINLEVVMGKAVAEEVFVNVEVFERVSAVIVAALCVDPDEVGCHARLREDLGAESLDMLDISFRLEKEFGTKFRYLDTPFTRIRKRQLRQFLGDDAFDGLDSVRTNELRESHPELFYITVSNICLEMQAMVDEKLSGTEGPH